MVRQKFQDNDGFTLVETLAVLLIVSIIIIILVFNPVKSYDKYKERLAVNEVVSDFYLVQTNSLNTVDPSYIEVFPTGNKYMIVTKGKTLFKYLSTEGKMSAGITSQFFRYRKGNLISKANTIRINFKNSSYDIIIHLDTGYITVNEV